MSDRDKRRVDRPALSRVLLVAASPGVSEVAHELDDVIEFDDLREQLSFDDCFRIPSGMRKLLSSRSLLIVEPHDCSRSLCDASASSVLLAPVGCQ